MFEGIFQPTHLLIILVIVLIIFGPGKLPELGKALGQGIREFRDSTAGQLNSVQATPAEPTQPLPAQPYAQNVALTQPQEPPRAAAQPEVKPPAPSA